MLAASLGSSGISTAWVAQSMQLDCWDLITAPQQSQSVVLHILHSCCAACGSKRLFSQDSNGFPKVPHWMIGLHQCYHVDCPWLSTLVPCSLWPAALVARFHIVDRNLKKNTSINSQDVAKAQVNANSESEGQHLGLFHESLQESHTSQKSMSGSRWILKGLIKLITHLAPAIPCTLPDWHIWTPIGIETWWICWTGSMPHAFDMSNANYPRTALHQHHFKLRVRHDFNFKHGYLKQSTEPPTYIFIDVDFWWNSWSVDVPWCPLPFGRQKKPPSHRKVYWVYCQDPHQKLRISQDAWCNTSGHSSMPKAALTMAWN